MTRAGKPRGGASPDATARTALAALAGAAILFHGAIVLALTPLTHHLDDIKKALFYAFGGLLLPAAVGAAALGALPRPRPVALASLGAYLLAMLVSTLFSRHRWAGWEPMVFQLASCGFFAGGIALGCTEKGSRLFLRYAVAIFLAATVFGFLQYDLFGDGRTFTQWLWDRLYPEPLRGQPTPFQSLLYTFVAEAKLSLMSTILNRDFFAAFCLLYTPAALATAICATTLAERAIGATAAVFGLVAVFLCQSKGEYIFGAASLALFALGYALLRRGGAVRWSLVGAWAGGPALLLGALLLLNLPTLTRQLKTLALSFESRGIIFSGAWGIFRDHPLFGSGPGTFVILFPRYRRPDYFRNEISNVTEFAHNYALDILSETGLLGAATFGLFAGALVFFGARAALRSSDYRVRVQLLALFCGLFGFMGSNMTSTSARWPIGAVNLWLFLGVLAGVVARVEGWTIAADGGIFAPGAAGRTQETRARALAVRRTFAVAAVLAGIFAVVGVRAGLRYWQGSLEYNKALTDFERVLRFHMSDLRGDPNSSPERRALAQGYLVRSAEGFRRCIAIDPSNLSAYYKLGSVENYVSRLLVGEREDRVQAARKAYEDLASLAPDYAEIHYNLGIVYYTLAQMRREELDRVGAAIPERRAALEAEIARYEDLSRAYYETMGRMSEKDDVLLNQAIAYSQAGMRVEAREVLRRALTLYPDQKRFAEWMLAVCRDLDDPEGQVDAFRAIFLIEPSEATSNFFPALGLAREAGLDDRFDELVALMLERNPVDPRLYAHLTLQREARGRFAEAADAARKFLRLIRNPDMNRIMPQTTDEARVLETALRAAEAAGDGDAAAEFRAALAEHRARTPPPQEAAP